jgi:CheY-like chemotaxis protein
MPSVLLVDDEPESRDVLGIMLAHVGFDVIVAANGQDALHLAEKAPDLILLDLHLPSLDGFEVCRRLRALPSTRRIPICAMTALYAGSAEKHEILDAGADAFLRKPIDPTELRATLSALLTTSPPARQIA